ncbi:MAG: hypothetical protein ABH811_00330 [archaeon]
MNRKIKSKILHYDFFPKNRKGFLLAEETLKIIIAVICIGFLVYFLTSLYLKNKENKDFELAKASLEHLVWEINTMKEGESRGVEIYNPKGWWISSWPYGDIRPNQCTNLNWENCICICPSNDPWDSVKTFFSSATMITESADKCDDKGICVEITEEFLVKKDNQQTIMKIVDLPLKLEIKGGVISKAK